MIENALQYSHTLLKEIVTSGDTVVDATMGNGNDTLFLAQLVGAAGHVYAFDIQKQALVTTQQKISQHHLESQTTLLQQGHETLGDVLPPRTSVTAAIFNLGYLPKSSKTIITKPATTKQALDSLLPRLIHHGRIVVVVYYGHEGGQLELAFMEEYCRTLAQEQYTVLRYAFTNQQHQPPILFCIEKK